MTRNGPGVVACGALCLVAGCLSGYPPYATYGPPGVYGTAPWPSGSGGRVVEAGPRPASRPAAKAEAPAPAAAPVRGEAAATPAQPSPAVEAGRLVVGLNAGFMIADGIGPGADLTFTYRIDDFVGIRFSIGHYAMSDQSYEGSYTPVLVRGIFSAPLREGTPHRVYWGIGAGRAISDGTERDPYYPGVRQTRSEATVYFLEWGREHVMADSRRARVQIGVLFGDDAEVEAVSFTCGMDSGR